MKKFVIYVASLLIPVFSGIALVNYKIDPSHIYSNKYVDKVVEGARLGLNVTNVGDMDERSYKEKFASVYQGRSFDYLVLGSSRAMTISEDAFDGSTVLNLGVSGCKIEDLMAFYEICKEYNVQYFNVIIGADPTLFNDYDEGTRWKAIEHYYYRFIGTEKRKVSFEFWEKIKKILDVSYARMAIKSLPKLLFGNNDIDDLEYVETYMNDGATKRTDGSIYYAKAYRESPQESKDNLAMTWTHDSFKNFNSASEEKEVMFETLIDTFTNNRVQVILFRSPYHPLFYQRVRSMNGFQESMEYIDELGESKKVETVGYFNPENMGLKNTDFYDAAHLRKEVVDEIFKTWQMEKEADQ